MRDNSQSRSERAALILRRPRRAGRDGPGSCVA